MMGERRRVRHLAAAASTARGSAPCNQLPPRPLDVASAADSPFSAEWIDAIDSTPPAWENQLFEQFIELLNNIYNISPIYLYIDMFYHCFFFVWIGSSIYQFILLDACVNVGVLSVSRARLIR